MSDLRNPMSDLHDEFNPKKLDVLSAVREAYSGAWNHLGEMLKLIWLPGVLYLALNVTGAMLADEGHDVIRLLIEMATLFLWPIIAVAWHRFILLGETPAGTYQINFGQREARFLMVSFFLVLLMLPGFFIATMTAGLQDMGPSASLVGFAGILLAFVGIYFLIRLLLLLPAVAIDEPINARFILERTRGNFWRLVALCVLSSLPLLAAYWLIMYVFVVANLPLFIPLFLSSLLSIFFAIVNVAILSIAFRELIGPPGTLAANLDRPDAL
jgi:hypothetical protein